MGEFDDIIPEYVAESSELLETVEAGLLRLEEGDAPEETVHTVFRAIHSIKGGAGFVGLTKIERLAHKMEDLLNLIRNHDMEPSQPVTDALLQSLDVLTSLFQHVGEHEGIDIEGSLRALAAALDAGVDTGLREAVNTMGSPNPQAGLPAFEVSSYTLSNKIKQGNLFHITMDMSQIESRGLTPMQLVSEMLSMGEILDSKLDLPEVGDPQTYEVASLRFHVLYATVLEADLLSAALRLEEGEARLVGPEDFEGQAAGQPAPAAPQPRQAPVPAPAPAPVPELPEPPSPEPRKSGEYLTFTLGKEYYGVDVLCVQEIIGLPILTRLPRSPEHVLGVMNLRGMVVPVLDLRRKLNLSWDESQEPVVVVLRVGDKIMGAVVDSVSDVVQFDEEQVQAPPEFAGAVRRDYLRGLSRHDQEMIILLELDRLLAQEGMVNAA